MGFARGKYGVEYHRPVDREAHPLRWILPCLAVLVAVSFVAARRRRPPRPATSAPPPAPVVEAPRPDQPPPRAEATPVRDAAAAHTPRPTSPAPASPAAPAPSTTPPRRPAPSDAFAAKVDTWLGSRAWPKAEMELLVMLRDAERKGSLSGARGAIESLMYRATVEDLKDQLVRRLGALNTQLLFSGTNTPWTATIAVKRGDNLQRIALEHRTTVEALRRLNPQLTDPNRLVIGQKLRVLNFPDADLVVHKQLQFAELLLKKRIFKRYYITVRADAEPGAYPVSTEAGARAADRLKALVQQIAPADRDELRLFLAPGSRITVTAQ